MNNSASTALIAAATARWSVGVISPVSAATTAAPRKVVTIDIAVDEYAAPRGVAPRWASSAWPTIGQIPPGTYLPSWPTKNHDIPRRHGAAAPAWRRINSQLMPINAIAMQPAAAPTTSQPRSAEAKASAIASRSRMIRLVTNTMPATPITTPIRLTRRDRFMAQVEWALSRAEASTIVHGSGVALSTMSK